LARELNQAGVRVAMEPTVQRCVRPGFCDECLCRKSKRLAAQLAERGNGQSALAQHQLESEHSL
jgi:hypothetical protein